MEQFYFQEMTVLIIIGIVLLLAMITTFFHIKNKKPKYIFIGSFIGLLLIIGYIAIGLNKHQPLIDKLSYENAAVRSYKKAPFMTFPYSHTERQVYRTGYMKDTFENIGIYETLPLQAEVDYLGSSEQYVYFDMGNQIVYTAKNQATVSNELNAPVRIGTQYVLRDQRFTDLGFVAESSRFLDGYLIPKNLQDKIADPAIHENAVYQAQEDSINGWIMP